VLTIAGDQPCELQDNLYWNYTGSQFPSTTPAGGTETGAVTQDPQIVSAQLAATSIALQPPMNCKQLPASFGPT